MNLQTDIFTRFDKDWAVLAAGTKGRSNGMTISWGGMGTLWGKPVATVYVRDSRYTLQFMEKNDYFTLSFYPENCRRALGIMGSKSGRDGDKWKLAGLTETEIAEGEAAGRAVTAREAVQTLVCRKLYEQKLDVSAVPEDVKRAVYGEGDVHNMFIGEVIAVL